MGMMGRMGRERRNWERRKQEGRSKATLTQNMGLPFANAAVFLDLFFVLSPTCTQYVTGRQLPSAFRRRRTTDSINRTLTYVVTDLLCHLLWLRLKSSSSPGYKGLFTKVHHIFKYLLKYCYPLTILRTTAILFKLF